MAIKPRTVRYSLEFMGPGWEECYLEARLLHWKDQVAIDELKDDPQLDVHQRNIKTLQMFFVSGKGLDDQGRVIDMTPEDLETFDIFTTGELVGRVGMPDPKVSQPSGGTSEDLDQHRETISDSSTGNDLV